MNIILHVRRRILSNPSGQDQHKLWRYDWGSWVLWMTSLCWLWSPELTNHILSWKTHMGETILSSMSYERRRFRPNLVEPEHFFAWTRQRQKTEEKPKNYKWTFPLSQDGSSQMCWGWNDVPGLTLITMFQGQRQHELQRCAITAAWLVQWRFWGNINYDVLETTSTWWYHT